MAQAGSSKKKLDQNVKVAVRVRPLNSDEKLKKVKNVIHCISSKEIQSKEKKYVFDRVFEPNTSQMDVYEYVVGPMIKDVMLGYNCTVFAYGQTGTGKTHTMTGADLGLADLNWKKDESAGCIPRAGANIFDELGSMNVTHYNVRVSFLELYNEEVRDLLSDDDRLLPLNIFNDNKGSIYVQNLKEVTVFSSGEIYKLLQQGTIKRQTASTLMNNQSSRSHTVFTITVHTQTTENGEDVLKTGKINLVDLAGSENIAKSGAKDKRAQELANINRSLLTLGRVIQILAEKTNKYVPYRDSKLTRILKDSLGGNTKTCIIATISPSHLSNEETQSTLEYASRARNICNTPTVNEKVTKAHMIKDMTSEIERLKKDLDAARAGTGFFVDRENWETLNSLLQSSSSALNNKSEIIQDLKQKISDLETVRDIKEQKFEEVMNACKDKDNLIHKAKSVLKNQAKSLKQEKYVARCYLEAAAQNNSKAIELLETSKHLSKNQEILQKKLEKQYYINYANEKNIKEKTSITSNHLETMSSRLDDFRNIALSDIKKNKTDLEHVVNKTHEQETTLTTTWRNDELPKLQSKFDGVICYVVDTNQQGIRMISGTQKEVEQVIGQIRDNQTTCRSTSEMFQKNTNSLCKNLYTIRSQMVKMKTKKQHLLGDLVRYSENIQEELSELDTAVSNIDETILSWNNNIESSSQSVSLKISANISKIEENHQLFLDRLGNATNSLDSCQKQQRENEKHLVTSIKDIQKEEKQTVDRNIETISTFFFDSLNVQEGCIKSLERLEQEITNGFTDLQTSLNSLNNIKRDMDTQLISAQRGGDTPKQDGLNYSYHLGTPAPHRDSLIRRFNEEFSMQDLENQSFNLNTSSDSFLPLDDTDSTAKSDEDVSLSAQQR